MKNILASLIVVLSALSCWGYEPIDSAVVLFRISHRQFDPTLGENRSSMNTFLERVKTAKSINNIDRIVVRAYASPDGEYNANNRLTGYRCEEISNYIIKNSGVDPTLIQSIPEGIAWAELRRRVAANKDVPSQEKVLDILDNTPLWIYDDRGRIVDGRKKQLQELDHGVPYRWLFDNIFPALRNAVAASLFLKSDATAAAMDSVATGIEGRLVGSSERLTAAESRLAAAESRLTNAEQIAAAAEAKKAAAEGLAATAEGHKATKSGLEAAGKGLTAVEEGREATKSGREAAAEGLSAVAKGHEAVAQGRLADAEALAEVAEKYAEAAEANLSTAENRLSLAEEINRQKGTKEIEEADVEGALKVSSEGLDHDPLHRFALKTNLLYDVLLMPNLELQWRINSLWSLSLEANVAWWKNDAKHKYYQILMVSPEVRRFVIPKGEWHGMYVGAFVGGGKFDLENGGTGYRGEGGMVGVSAGYMWPVTRTLSLEAELGLGYLYSRYKEYIPHDGHYLYQRTKDLNYFGPLKVKFALAWRFNDINKPKKVNPAL